MLGYLDLKKHRDLVFWAILLVGFFGMLRKSNLIPDSQASFDPIKQLTRGARVVREGYSNHQCNLGEKHAMQGRCVAYTSVQNT